MLRAGIVGCGKIADAHLEQMRRIAGCQVVAAVDREPLMARQLCERFEVPRPFSSLDEMLSECRPDVVHITTPPESHFELARRCLQAGAHVYVEKPFTLYARESEELIALATRVQRKLTVGHDLQFSPAMRRLRQFVQQGYLGGQAVHLESYYCYDLSDARYARALLANSQHWVRKLPGKLLHNIISHGVARIAEFLTTDNPQVVAHGFTSPVLASLGEREIVDELRVIISEAGRTTAYFTFSSQMAPGLNAFRVYGPRNGLMLDEDHQTVIRYRGARYKSYAERFVPPLTFAREYLRNLTANLRLFARNDFHMKSGMKCLMESFYRSIDQGTPLPISYREILLTARIMDSIFEQLNARPAVPLPDVQPCEPAALPKRSSEPEMVAARS